MTPDCRKCGACCAGTPGVRFALPITKSEAKKLPTDVVGDGARVGRRR